MNKIATRGLKDTQAGPIIGLKPQTLRNQRSKGEGPPYYKIGRAVRYLEKDLLDYLEKRKIQTEG
jgi:predicted DNA-binding transcriptional regulator AlpA